MWQAGDFPLELLTKSGGEMEIGGRKEKERKEMREEEKMSEKLHLISRIVGYRTVGFHWSKKESSFT